MPKNRHIDEERAKELNSRQSGRQQSPKDSKKRRLSKFREQKISTVKACMGLGLVPRTKVTSEKKEKKYGKRLNSRSDEGRRKKEKRVLRSRTGRESAREMLAER